jgi:two-component system cell cycle response regulator
LDSEARDLRIQLHTLLEEARINEKIFRRFDRLERDLIAAHSLSDLIQSILLGLKFILETDAATLTLVDPEYEITRILEENKKGSSEMPGLVIVEKLFHESMQPYLGPFDNELPGAIFDPWPSGCRSMALLPLVRQGELIGSLNLASLEADRYGADSGTLYLERLASVFPICLENALNLERLKQTGLTDHLTGINNRRYFEARCREEAAHARRYNTPLACMFLDVDKFKGINDSLGHLAGDKVLCEVAHLIKSQMRINDLVARYGGEEFIVLMPQTDGEQACEIAERIRTLVAAHPFQPSTGETLKVTISIGVALLPDDSQEDDEASIREMVHTADSGVYQAKEQGRNRVIFAG